MAGAEDELCFVFYKCLFMIGWGTLVVEKFATEKIAPQHHKLVAVLPDGTTITCNH